MGHPVRQLVRQWDSLGSEAVQPGEGEVPDDAAMGEAAARVAVGAERDAAREDRRLGGEVEVKRRGLVLRWVQDGEAEAGRDRVGVVVEVGGGACLGWRRGRPEEVAAAQRKPVRRAPLEARAGCQGVGEAKVDRRLPRRNSECL